MASAVTKLLNGLIGSKKILSTAQRHPDVYYKHVYLSRKMYDGVVFIAKCERKPKTQVVNELLALGLRCYFGDKIKQEIKEDIVNEKLKKDPELVRFIFLLRKFARAHSKDVSKLCSKDVTKLF